jgi:hypothetical protein
VVIGLGALELTRAQAQAHLSLDVYSASIPDERTGRAVERLTFEKWVSQLRQFNGCPDATYPRLLHRELSANPRQTLAEQIPDNGRGTIVVQGVATSLPKGGVDVQFSRVGRIGPAIEGKQDEQLTTGSLTLGPGEAQVVRPGAIRVGDDWLETVVVLRLEPPQGERTGV